MSTTPSNTPSAAPALDAQALAKLRELDPTGRSGIVQRVLQTFDGSLVRLSQQFTAARAGGDLAGMKHVAHTLRSSAASVGALGLSKACGEVETRIRDGRSDGLPEALETMALECGLAAQAVRAMLDSAGNTA